MSGISEGLVLLDRYRIEAPAGSGGFGVVYRACDRLRGGPVAVKVLRGRAERREVTALMACRFPGVARLLDEGEHEGAHFLVVDWVDGRPFPGAAGDDGSTLRATERLLRVLDAVHRVGVVHRDLKPANVLVSPDGLPVVLDFGLARGAGASWGDDTPGGSGTLRYAAPEQLLGAAPTPASDLYGVGVMVYEALTGRAPHEDHADPVLARLTRPAPSVASHRQDLPAEAVAAIDRLLARDPLDRFASGQDAADTLAPRRLQHLPGDAGAVTRWIGAPERAFRLRTRAVAAVVGESDPSGAGLARTVADWVRDGVVDEGGRLDGAALRARVARRRAHDRAALLPTEPEALARQVLAWCATDRLTGDDAAALALLGSAVTATRSLPGATRALLLAGEPLALASADPRPLEELRYLVRRAEDPALAATGVTLHAALLVARGEPERALEVLVGVDTSSALGVAVQATRTMSPAVQERAVEALERAAAATGDPWTRHLAASARGAWLYRIGRYTEAAERHEAASREAPGPGPASRALANAAAAWLEVPDPGRAERLAGRLLRSNRERWTPEVTAMAWHLARAARYRSGRDLRPDARWVAAASGCGLDLYAAMGGLTEAAAAWRRGELRLAGALAGRSEATWRRLGRGPIATLAGALRAVSVGCAAEERTTLASEARASSVPGLGAQALWLLAGVDRASAAGWRAAARDLAVRAGWPEGCRIRREVCSPEEITGADDGVHDR